VWPERGEGLCLFLDDNKLENTFYIKNVACFENMSHSALPETPA